MSPFDLRSVLLAKHAQHVVLIHFPIALFMVGVLFDFVGDRTDNQSLSVVAYYNLLLAAIAAVPTAVTGLLAWRFALEGAKLKGALLFHLVAGITLTVLMLLVASLHFRGHRHHQSPPRWRLPLEALTFILVGLTAHLGGFLSGVNA